LYKNVQELRIPADALADFVAVSTLLVSGNLNASYNLESISVLMGIDKVNHSKFIPAACHLWFRKSVTNDRYGDVFVCIWEHLYPKYIFSQFLRRTLYSIQKFTTMYSLTDFFIPFHFRIQRTCGECVGQWQRRWLVVKDSFVAYVRPKDGRLHCVMLVDVEFEVSSGVYSSGVPNGVIITNLSR